MLLVAACGGSDAPATGGTLSAPAGGTLAGPAGGALGASVALADSSLHQRPETCAACHADEVAAWRGSDHDRALEPATAASVEADFDAAPFTWTRGGREHTAAFRRDGGAFFVTMEDATGTPREFRVLATFGARPLQQYLVQVDPPATADAAPDLAALLAAFHAEGPPPTPLPELQCLPVAWDTVLGRWFHLEPDAEPGTPFHWTGRYQTWNLMCAECHSTGLTKGHDPERGTYATSWVEPDVGCRACHGDASDHLRLVDGLEPGERPTDYPAGGGFALDLASTGDLQVDTCAPCHARRSEVLPGHRPGSRFLDHHDPALLREGLYHADGAILDEVYVWGSFVQSRMHAAGVSCTDCHDPHTARLNVGLPTAVPLGNPPGKGADAGAGATAATVDDGPSGGGAASSATEEGPTSTAGTADTGVAHGARASAGLPITDPHRRTGAYTFDELDAVCASCHGEATATAMAPRFPTLRAADYATVLHHRHGADLDTDRPELLREAAACVTCHMPEETYMVVDARRDHAMRVPRAGSGETGPDLCLRCHETEGGAWAADQLRHWVARAEGDEGAPGRALPGHAGALAAARAGNPAALAGLVDLATDPDRPPLVRATAVELAAAWGPAARPAVLHALNADRAAPLAELLVATGLRAARAADLPPDPALVATVEGLLDDPSPHVRLALARWANRTRWGTWARPELRERVTALAVELEASLDHQADMPATWLDRGILAEERGEAGPAEAAYRRALALDPGLYPASMNLATLLSRGGDRAGLGAARAVLEEALDADPPKGGVEGELAYSLGLVRAEQGDLAGAVAPLERAAAALPDQPRVDRNLCLVLWNLGRETDARAVATRALGRLEALPADRRTPEHDAIAAELGALLDG